MTNKEQPVQDQDPVRGFRIPNQLFTAVKRKARREDLTTSQVVRRLLADWVGTEIHPDEEED